MGSTSDKAAGLANQAAGNVKQAVGKAFGNERLQVEGAVQENKGKVQKAVGDMKAVAKDVTDTAAAAINKKL
jgi:uncharacterized protein YjbJ (UPF0337 family)